MPTTNKSGIASKVASLEAIETEIRDFLRISTPRAWIEHACGSLDTLLIDHANCEYKAAATGMSLIHKYRSNTQLQRLMARLVREEMLHYEQVLMFMERFGVAYRPLSASRYAQSLREAISSEEPMRLTDLLVVGAVVEARSCERFASLWPHLPDAFGEVLSKPIAIGKGVTTKITWRWRLKRPIETPCSRVLRFFYRWTHS